MRSFVIFLGLLAVVKLGVQEHLFRSGTRDVIVSAYRDRAAAACQKDVRSTTSGAGAQVWSRPAEIKLVIGKSDIDVHFWEMDNALWSARYRNPYLFLYASDRPGSIYCEYDVVRGVAAVHRM